ncbi:MAG: MlaD family protein [Alistipes sp.]|nr:MlaD family protein [Alistipes sp.]
MKLRLSREFKIGFFGILMLALLYWGINFLKGKDLFSTTSHYYAVYDQVNGLQSSASVLIKGFKVGTISDISYNPQSSPNVVVEFAVKSKYHIPKDSKARVFSEGLMSGKAVELELGKSPDYLQEGDTLFSEINKDFLEMAGSEVEFFKQRANEVINELMTTLKRVNTLLADNKANFDASMQNIASLSGNLDQMVQGERHNIHGILVNLNEFSAALNGKTEQMGRIMGNVERFSDSLSAAQIPTMVAQATQTLDQLNITLNKVNHGEGSASLLLNDPALYDSLVVSVSNLSALLEDLKAHPSRYINISVFGRRDRE